jgi:hypothetical protein
MPYPKGTKTARCAVCDKPTTPGNRTFFGIKQNEASINELNGIQGNLHFCAKHSIVVQKKVAQMLRDRQKRIQHYHARRDK